MFKKLKEKLKFFKKKASIELEDEIEEVIEDTKKDVKKTTFVSHKIREGKLNDVLDELELILLESDVAINVIEAINNDIREQLSGKKVKENVSSVIENALKKAILNVLQTNKINFDDYVKNHEKPVIIMFVGVNGTGKTTTIARIVYRLKKMGLSSVLAASDTFRAGAIEQIEIHSQRLGVRLIKHQHGSDPSAVAYDAIEHAKARKKDVVLIDTAGRMQTNINLMDEMKKINRVANPDLVVFVGDSLTGNDAIDQAQKFNDAIGLDAAILTKIDTDAKGGAALSIAYAIGKPLLFIGVGQEYKDLVPFDAESLVERLFED